MSTVCGTSMSMFYVYTYIYIMWNIYHPCLCSISISRYGNTLGILEIIPGAELHLHRSSNLLMERCECAALAHMYIYNRDIII